MPPDDDDLSSVAATLRRLAADLRASMGRPDRLREIGESLGTVVAPATTGQIAQAAAIIDADREALARAVRSNTMPPDYEIDETALLRLDVRVEQSTEAIELYGRPTQYAVGRRDVRVTVEMLAGSGLGWGASCVTLHGQQFVAVDTVLHHHVDRDASVTMELRPTGTLPDAWFTWAQFVHPARGRSYARTATPIETTTHGDDWLGSAVTIASPRSARVGQPRTQKPATPRLVGQPKRRVFTPDDDGA